MSDLLLITNALEPSAEVLPALGLLLHPVRVLPADASALVEAPPADAVLMDARRELVQAKSICRLLQTTGLDCPLFAIVTEGGLAAVNAEWGVDDVILHTAGPAEVEARVRLAIGRRAAAVVAEGPTRSARASWPSTRPPTRPAARPRARSHLQGIRAAQVPRPASGPGLHPGAALQEVWGYDYFGGTRTGHVHVRRLRAKLGPEHEALIGTVRNVGYRFVPVKGDRAAGDERARGKQDPAAPGCRETIPRPRPDDRTADRQSRTHHRSGQRDPGPGRGGAPGRRRGALSEHGMLHLRYDSASQSGGGDYIVTADGVIAGYAYLDPPSAEGEVTGELVIHPERRRQGLGRALTGELAAAAAGTCSASGPTATCPRPPPWPGRRAWTVSAPCGRCAGHCVSRWTSPCSGRPDAAYLRARPG